MAHFAAPGSYCGAKRGDFEFRYFDEFPSSPSKPTVGNMQPIGGHLLISLRLP
jgi:hypothetical protein